jgi:acetoin utilization deacetylase AcuC-like enzyme
MESVFLEHPASQEHETGSHPEQAGRIAAIERELDSRDWLGFRRLESAKVDRDVLTAVHPEGYVAAVERVCQAGGGALDPDTIVSRGSCRAALHAAGGAVQLAQLLLDGAAQAVFSAHRPPGHHALPERAMGFCLFNNIAVATRFALDHRGLDRVMIVDWDVHHGNGTNDIFHSTDRVLFVSMHQSPLYPGTGPADDVGSGDGVGFTVNLPVPPGSGDAEFVSLVEHVAVPLAVAFGPQLVLVSAGYDAHREDPLGSCEVTEAGYARMTRAMRRAAAGAGAPIGFVLEGGYAQRALARSVVATMEAQVMPLGEPADDEVAPVSLGGGEPAPLARAARARLAQWWPSLAE